MTKVIFMAGLPRAGSTVLMNILGQNPDIEISTTSGLFNLLTDLMTSYTRNHAVNATIDKNKLDERFESACKGFLEGWVHSDKKIYIDKSRGWPQHLEFLEYIGIEIKILIPIRDVRGVLSSFERIHRKNYLRQVSEHPATLTVAGRVQNWVTTVPVGNSMACIEDLISRKHEDKVLFIRYEDLTETPNTELERIYKYIGEPYYAHNFEKIDQIVFEDDRSVWGINNLHTINSSLHECKKDWNDVLGEELSCKVVQNMNWFYKKFYPSEVVRNGNTQ